jgi:hypothetical protein
VAVFSLGGDLSLARKDERRGNFYSYVFAVQPNTAISAATDPPSPQSDLSCLDTLCRAYKADSVLLLECYDLTLVALVAGSSRLSIESGAYVTDVLPGTLCSYRIISPAIPLYGMEVGHAAPRFDIIAN